MKIRCRQETRILPSDIEELGVQQGCVHEIGEKVLNLVRVRDWSSVLYDVLAFGRYDEDTAYPVLGDSLGALLSSVAPAFALNTKPALDHIVTEPAGGIRSAVICHEAEDKRVSCRLHSDAGEWTIEEVRVIGNLRIEAVRAEGREGVDSNFAAGRVVDKLLKLLGDCLVVVSSLVEIRARRGGVTLVLVV